MAKPSTILSSASSIGRRFVIRTAHELGFTPSARASLGMIEESGRGGPRLIDEVDPFDEFR
jgi:phage terminase small subunit